MIGTVRPGECYPVAVRVAEALAYAGHESVRVVHGRPLGTGGEAEGLRYGHAWVEVGETVHDASNPRLGLMSLPAVVYYAIGNIKDDECSRYSLAEVRQAMAEHGHYGPWNKNT